MFDNGLKSPKSQEYEVADIEVFVKLAVNKLVVFVKWATGSNLIITLALSLIFAVQFPSVTVSNLYVVFTNGLTTKR